MRIRAAPHGTAFVTRTGVSFGAVAGIPQALMSDGSGALGQLAADAEPEANGDGAAEFDAPFALQPASRRASAHAATTRRGDGMSKGYRRSLDCAFAGPARPCRSGARRRVRGYNAKHFEPLP